jgi:hypothetical protein
MPAQSSNQSDDFFRHCGRVAGENEHRVHCATHADEHQRDAQ